MALPDVFEFEPGDTLDGEVSWPQQQMNERARADARGMALAARADYIARVSAAYGERKIGTRGRCYLDSQAYSRDLQYELLEWAKTILAGADPAAAACVLSRHLRLALLDVL